MSKLLDRLFSWIKLIELVAMSLAGAAMFIMMAIVVVDVLGRYGLNSPLSWSYELVSNYVLGVTFFFALSDTLRRKRHVNVDIFYARFGRRTQLFCNALGWSLSGLLFLTITVQVAQITFDNWLRGDVIYGVVMWPIWVRHAIAMLGLALISARLLLGAFAFSIAFATADARYSAAAMEKRDKAVEES